MTRQILIATDARSRVQGSRHQHGGRLPRHAPCLTVVLAIAGLTFAAPEAHSQSITGTAFWYGSAGANWNTAGNWGPTTGGTTSSVPGNGAVLRWFGSSTNNRTSTNDMVGLSAGGMSFQSASGTYTLNGSNTLTLTGGISGVAPTSVTINMPLEINTNTLTVEGGNDALTINGSISETGGSRGLNAQSGTMTFTGNNSFSGGMILGVGSNATIKVNALANIGSSQPLGSGTTITFGHSSGNGTIIYTGTADASTDKRFQVGRSAAASTGAGGVSNNGTGVVTWTGSQALATSNTSSLVFTLGGSNTNNNTWQSAIANNSATGLIGLTKAGTGKWILSGSNTYDGLTTVSAGTLLVNGNQSGAIGAVSVAAGAILGGTGTLGAASAAITGTVAPGLSDALGTLSVAGSAMNFSSGGSLLAQLNSNPAVFTSDLLSLTGAGSLTLGGSSILDLVGPASFTTSGTYTLATFASGSLTGQFTTVRYNGATFANPTNPNAVNSGGTLVYNGDSIQFVVVPEPATLVLAGLGVGLAGLMLKHRRRPL
jgi:autotransporter-associated beta strand protein